MYLRTRRTGTLRVTPDTLNVGFRVAVIDEPREVPALVDLFDRALVRARRHALALGGHGLADDLRVIAGLDKDRRLPGVTGVSQAWVDRTSKGRGMAHMVDTRHDVADTRTARLDAPLDASAVTMCPTSTRDAELTAATSLTRCLAIALTVAWHRDAYRWDGTFSVRNAIASVAWDRFTELTQADIVGSIDRGNLSGRTGASA